ncbi:hypothetical protein LX15_001489 [Streptoalloteichus tenebrarius]|uniref:Uncharacterized protein n=1 Tax=Streptoalloteichus tenebrarius (strain ATCC 17920 / DSM 40477 / JCM 4838 / CBS 697.72 / NBRC 16177 / NCIMB 11028 / NRRL B-12390 / A12253. 1 / ISP 5477) TaxID=1933 RepID=A0ABT1HQM6_STRSD|nr:hypothetical protein [Streptoalloteichus tenebrarius]MCP2257803.1 hypothetical protein [Streptoalloteichus tenebrarius]BFE99833.1 hypothetical protein GCM10020241_15090 [Streptoalloteichus tenebrarius]
MTWWLWRWWVRERCRRVMARRGRLRVELDGRRRIVVVTPRGERVLLEPLQAGALRAELRAAVRARARMDP